MSIASEIVCMCVCCWCVLPEQERIVHRAATSITSVVTEIPLSVQCTLLMDYVDEVFDLVAGAESNPNEMFKFIDSCIDVQHYS